MDVAGFGPSSLHSVSLGMDPRHYPAHLIYGATLFDAPGRNPPRSHERWEAETYLVICPDIGRSPQFHALLGMSWGYDAVRSAGSLRPLVPVGEEDWQRNLLGVMAACPDRTFARHLGE